MSETELFAGRYELIELAGRGGMAEVWLAEQRGAAGFARPVGLKRILPHLARKELFVRMFIEEARVCAQLMHPNIIQIYDFGFERGTYYLVMEWVSGVNLAHLTESYRLRGRSVPWPVVAGIGIEALRALSAAHDHVSPEGEPAPVIHRDVTPPNILLSLSGVVKLSDFGLARAMDRARITDPNVIKGKMAYLAPELTHGVPATPRSDLYALGITLWQTLAGRAMFEGASQSALLLAARSPEIPELSRLRPDIPSELADIVRRALSFRPGDRFESAGEMRAALTQLLRSGSESTDAPILAGTVRDARRALGLPATGERPATAPLV